MSQAAVGPWRKKKMTMKNSGNAAALPKLATGAIALRIASGA
jgi:hypothetical protein